MCDYTTKKSINNKNKNINLLYSFKTYTLSLLNISLKRLFLRVKDTLNPDGEKSR